MGADIFHHVRRLYPVCASKNIDVVDMTGPLESRPVKRRTL